VPFAGGARFTGVMPLGTELNKSSTTLTINARRVSDNTVALGTSTQTVTRTNNISGCPL
jgi:hypothetical protein